MNNLFPWSWNDGPRTTKLGHYCGPLFCTFLNAINLAVFTVVAEVVWNYAS